jgi:hypothetical protein
MDWTLNPIAGGGVKVGWPPEGIDMKYAIAKCAGVACCAGLVLAMATAAKAADAFYVGTFYIGSWKLSGAVVAPWADPKRKPDSAEQARLIGKSVVFTATQITGPRPFTCATPHYKLSDFTAGMLFQGAFENMQSNDKAIDPGKIAASLGFSGNSIKTLETGCEIDFHFIDATSAEIGLNDRVYMLKKQ